jgi:hypothetical protein
MAAKGTVNRLPRRSRATFSKAGGPPGDGTPELDSRGQRETAVLLPLSCG